jgi:hypothetical protein
MAQRPCVCEGSNENCSHCFGRGFIDARDVPPEHKLEEQKSTGEDRVGEFVAKHPLLNPNPLNQPEGTKPRYRHHSADVAHKNLTDHKVERSLTAAASANARPALLRRGKHGTGRVNMMKITQELGTSICSSCRDSFSRFIDLVAHQQAGCPKPRIPLREFVQAQPVQGRQATKEPGKMTTCSHCGCPLKITNFRKHLGRCPKYLKNAGSRVKSQARISDTTRHPKAFHSIAEAKKADPRTGFAHANAFDPIDVTKGYAHSFRENGKYGSHPLHDGMDDESGPD